MAGKSFAAAWNSGVADYRTLYFFLITFLLFIITGTYTRRVNVTGEVITNLRPITIYSGVQGFVVKKFVNEGQHVKSGDPIYQIDVSRSTGVVLSVTI